MNKEKIFALMPILSLMICLEILFLKQSFAQNLNLDLKNYTRKDGLPSNETYFIFKDSESFLWIATDKGIVRYGGFKMEKFELEDNIIFKIREDEKKRIWFFSYSGKLFYFEKGKIHNYKNNNSISLINKKILITDGNVFNDLIRINSSNENNYSISKDGHISSYRYMDRAKSENLCFNIKTINNSFFAQKSADNSVVNEYLKIHVNDISGITYKIPFNQISSDQYGVISENNIYYFYNSNLIVKLYPNGSYILKQFPSTILSIHFGNQNDLWVGLSKGGAISLSKELNENEHILKEYSISSIEQDYERGIWFSTLEKGIFNLKKLSKKIYKDTDLLDQFVYRTSPQNDSNFLFVNNTGVYNYCSTKIRKIFNCNMRFVSDLLVDNDKILLGGQLKNTSNQKKYREGELFKISDYKYKKCYIIFANSEFKQTQNSHYFFNIGASFAEVNLIDSLDVNLSDNIFYSTKFTFKERFSSFKTQNNFWVATSTSLSNFNSTSDSLLSIKVNEPLFKKGITNMTQLDNGLFAIGLKFGGIALMKDSSIIANITEKDGLSSNSIKYMLPHKNYLWVATNNGISVIYFKSFSPLLFKIINVGSKEDFYDIDINHLAYFGNNVLAATNKGIYSFSDSLVLTDTSNVLPLPFYINTISYNKKDTQNISSISLPYKNNRININFNAICFNNSDALQYRYRIANNDTTWSYLTNPELLLENLSPGNYKLQLQALIKYQDRYSEIRELNITVEKPWWQNNYVRLLTALFILLCGYVFYQSRIKRINAVAKKELDTKSKFLELEQTALRSQMNPHFIFNCLSSIQQLIVSGESEKANEYLVKFSRLMRLTLELSESPFNSISDEVIYLSEYISLEQLRFPNQFDFSFNINDEIDKNNIGIPNMMIQPIVENAINHGIKYVKNRLGFISINMLIEKDILICSIKDNGVGRNFNKAQLNEYKTHKSFGMDIITKRLTTFNAEGESKYKMEVIDIKDQHNKPVGTEIILHLPVKKLL